MWEVIVHGIGYIDLPWILLIRLINTGIIPPIVDLMMIMATTELHPGNMP